MTEDRIPFIYEHMEPQKYDNKEISDELYGIHEAICGLDIEYHPNSIVSDSATAIMRIIDVMRQELAK